MIEYGIYLALVGVGALLGRRNLTTDPSRPRRGPRDLRCLWKHEDAQPVPGATDSVVDMPGGRVILSQRFCSRCSAVFVVTEQVPSDEDVAKWRVAETLKQHARLESGNGKGIHEGRPA